MIGSVLCADCCAIECAWSIVCFVIRRLPFRDERDTPPRLASGRGQKIMHTADQPRDRAVVPSRCDHNVVLSTLGFSTSRCRIAYSIHDKIQHPASCFKITQLH